MTELRRIIKSGCVNFARNGLISWVAVLVVTTTLCIITALLFLQPILDNALTQVKDKVDVTIYFTTNASEDDILTLQSSLEKLPEVASTAYVSANDALAAFRDHHKDDYPTIAALDEIGINPLGAYVNVKTKEVSQYDSIQKFLDADTALVLNTTSIVDKVSYNKLVIDKLDSIINGAQRLGFIVTLISMLISLIITFATVRLAIFSAREEVSVMRLVGASKHRIRGPFMVEGAVYGIVASIVTMVIFWPVTAWFGRSMTGFLGLNLYEYFKANFFGIFAIVLLSGIILGMISSGVAVRKYLNK